MPTQEEIVDFIEDFSGLTNLQTDTDLLQQGIYGDDLDDLLERYANKYKVDMSGYLWYFHNKGEGWSLGDMLSTPMNKQVKRIPVTPGMLFDFAQTGKWNIKYPEHQLSEQKPDGIVKTFFILLFILIVLLITCNSK